MSQNRANIINTLKMAVALGGAIGFLIASILLAFQARHYQLSGEPMPNGKGGIMTPVDAYLIALILFLFSVVWFLAARRFWRKKSK